MRLLEALEDLAAGELQACQNSSFLAQKTGFKSTQRA